MNPTWKIIENHAEQYHTSATRDGKHKNTVYPLQAFADLLQDIDNYTSENPETRIPQNLIDLGCGSGHLLAIALDAFSYYADGVDCDPEMVEAAQYLLRFTGNGTLGQVWQADALEADIKAYQVIVLNRLYVGPGQQGELESAVADRVSSGSYLVKLNNITTPEGFEIIGTNKYGGTVLRKP